MILKVSYYCVLIKLILVSNELLNLSPFLWFFLMRFENHFMTLWQKKKKYPTIYSSEKLFSGVEKRQQYTHHMPGKTSFPWRDTCWASVISKKICHQFIYEKLWFSLFWSETFVWYNVEWRCCEGKSKMYICP